MECHIVLTDPLSSRVHATIEYADDAWWVRDADSRNGTFVNGQKIDEAQLFSGCLLKLGASEFSFHQSTEEPTEEDDLHVTQTIVRNQPVNPHDTGNFALAALQDETTAQDFLVLYQLSIKLLSCTNPDEVVRTSLDLLHGRTRAAVVGFLWVSDDGSLKTEARHSGTERREDHTQCVVDRDRMSEARGDLDRQPVCGCGPRQLTPLLGCTLRAADCRCRHAGRDPYLQRGG